MARLTIEQVAAPDFSSTSSILANAAKSFDSGMESAKSLLGTYQAGQQTKADSLILNDIAKLGSEEELNAYLNSDALMGKNFSPKMQETIMGLRKGVLGYGQDRANIDSTTSATGRANAAEGRTAAEYLDATAAREERRGLTGAAVEAAVEGRQNGWEMGGTGISNTAEWQEANLTSIESGNGESWQVNKVAAEAFKSFLTELETTGYGIKSSGGFNYRPIRGSKTGKLSEHGKGLAIDLNAATNGLGSETTDLPPNVSAIAAKYGLKWGGDFKGRKDPMHFEYIGGGEGPVTQNPNSGGGPAMANYEALVASTLKMEPDEALKVLGLGWSAADFGQAGIDAAEKKRQDEAIAAGTLSAIQDPDNLTGTAVQQDMLRLPGQLPASALLAGAESAGNLAFGPLAGVVAPPTSVDPLVTAALSETGKLEANEAAKDPTFAAMGVADSFEASGDIAQALIEDVGGLAEGSSMDKNYIQNQIESIAESSGVTTAQAAATLADMTKAGIPLEDMLIGNDPDMNAAIRDRATTLYDEEAMKVASEKRLELNKSSESRASAELQLSTAQTRAAKLPEGSPEREAADAQIAVLKDKLLTGKTPQEVDQMFTDYVRSTGMASRLEGLSPDDPDFARAMMQLEEVIRVDKSLSDGEKKLLIAKLRG